MYIHYTLIPVVNQALEEGKLALAGQAFFSYR